MLKIDRLENGYRVYSEMDEMHLNKIKLLLYAGISIADIKLLFDDVVTIEEITHKRKRKSVVASGNAVQKNKVLQKIISDVFDMPVKISVQSEEASVGAALFSAVSAKYIRNFGEFSTYNHK